MFVISTYNAVQWVVHMCKPNTRNEPPAANVQERSSIPVLSPFIGLDEAGLPSMPVWKPPFISLAAIPVCVIDPHFSTCLFP